MKTIPFDLEKALAGAKVVTRDLAEVTQLCCFQLANPGHQPIRGVLRGELHGWSINGSFYSNGQSGSSNDLFLAVEPKLRAWKDASEVPVGAVLRARGLSGKFGASTISGSDGSGFVFANAMTEPTLTRVPFESSLNYEWVWPGKDDWKPCGVFEE